MIRKVMVKTGKAPKTLQALHTEFTRAISNYFCIKFSTPKNS